MAQQGEEPAEDIEVEAAMEGFGEGVAARNGVQAIFFGIGETGDGCANADAEVAGAGKFVAEGNLDVAVIHVGVAGWSFPGDSVICVRVK